ncbi:transposase [Leptolyngbya sp. FACHB-711]|uniref:transposase n=1 Tax=unclassified Leptolyngbya TaxID=2650499 RepID=UPI001686A5A7|nr:transposase [Leptolyngbya sp. FACHB-711]MBD1853275.1 transposase [Cyanobacteria bacterium FACHB-502]MBD2024523.1 transposase [Leptolyngbya sp. FACHB-711]
MRVLFLDKCQLLWGDISGYGWSRRKQRVDVEIKSTKQRQTYYGALDYLTKQFVVKEYSAGNEDNTVAFLQYLQSLYAEDTRLVIVWDGVSYHRSKVVQEFLGQTICFSKSEQMHDTVIGLYINHYEFGLQL